MKNKLFKTSLVLMSSVTLGTTLLPGVTTFATESDNQTTQEISLDVPINLDNGQHVSEEIITDDNGTELGTLMITEELPSIQSRHYANQALSNRNFDIKFIGVTVNFGYKVTVKNKKITNAYGKWSNGILWRTSLGKPYFNSTSSGVKGTTRVGYKDFSLNTTVRLTGKIQGNRLISNLSFK